MWRSWHFPHRWQPTQQNPCKDTMSLAVGVKEALTMALFRQVGGGIMGGEIPFSTRMVLGLAMAYLFGGWHGRALFFLHVAHGGAHAMRKCMSCSHFV